MRKITATNLKEQLDRGGDLLVINALDAESFEKEHIPGSHNVPNSSDDLVERVTELAGRKDRPIVVYCSGKDCDASVKAGKKLIDAGFTDVAHFEGGMAGWKLAGFEVESGATAEVRS